MMTLKLIDNELVPEDENMEMLCMPESNNPHGIIFNNSESIFTKAFFLNANCEYSFSCRVNTQQITNSVQKDIRFNYYGDTCPSHYATRDNKVLNVTPNKLPIPKSSKLADMLRDSTLIHNYLSRRFHKDFPYLPMKYCSLHAEREILRNLNSFNRLNIDPIYMEMRSFGSNGLLKNEILREQDYLFPITNVSRVMKTKLPQNLKISTEAKMCMQECVSEFIKFLTSEANDLCFNQKRKIVSKEDVFTAIINLDFACSFPPLKLFSNKMRKTNGNVRNTKSLFA